MIMIRKKNDPMRKISEKVLKSKPADMRQPVQQQGMQQPNNMMQGVPQGYLGQ